MQAQWKQTKDGMSGWMLYLLQATFTEFRLKIP